MEGTPAKSDNKFIIELTISMTYTHTILTVVISNHLTDAVSGKIKFAIILNSDTIYASSSLLHQNMPTTGIELKECQYFTTK